MSEVSSETMYKAIPNASDDSIHAYIQVGVTWLVNYRCYRSYIYIPGKRRDEGKPGEENQEKHKQAKSKVNQSTPNGK